MKTIDIKFYPHIFDNILAHASSDAVTLLKLRLLSSTIREQTDMELWRHVRRTDDGLRDSRGLALERMPFPLKLKDKYTLDVDISKPAPWIHPCQPGVLRLLRWPFLPRRDMSDDSDSSSDDSSSEDSGPAGDAAPDSSSEDSTSTGDTASDSGSEDSLSSSDSASDCYNEAPFNFNVVSAAEACIFLGEISGMLGDCCAPTVAITLDLDKYDPSCNASVYFDISTLSNPSIVFIVLQMCTRPDVASYPSIIVESVVDWAVEQSLTGLRSRYRSSLVFIVQDSQSSKTPSTFCPIQLDPSRFPTEDILKRYVSSSVADSPHFPVEALQSISYCNLEEFRHRVGNHMFQLMTDPMYRC